MPLGPLAASQPSVIPLSLYPSIPLSLPLLLLLHRPGDRNVKRAFSLCCFLYPCASESVYVFMSVAGVCVCVSLCMWGVSVCVCVCVCVWLCSSELISETATHLRE